jgi:hypothetical protein
MGSTTVPSINGSRLRISLRLSLASTDVEPAVGYFKQDCSRSCQVRCRAARASKTFAFMKESVSTSTDTSTHVTCDGDTCEGFSEVVVGCGSAEPQKVTELRKSQLQRKRSRCGAVESWLWVFLRLFLHVGGLQRFGVISTGKRKLCDSASTHAALRRAGCVTESPAFCLVHTVANLSKSSPCIVQTR